MHSSHGCSDNGNCSLRLRDPYGLSLGSIAGKWVHRLFISLVVDDHLRLE